MWGSQSMERWEVGEGRPQGQGAGRQQAASRQPGGVGPGMQGSGSGLFATSISDEPRVCPDVQLTGRGVGTLSWRFVGDDCKLPTTLKTSHVMVGPVLWCCLRLVATGVSAVDNCKPTAATSHQAIELPSHSVNSCNAVALAAGPCHSWLGTTTTSNTYRTRH